MKIGEQSQVGPQKTVFGLLRLLHFHYQIGLVPDFRRIRSNLRARLDVVRIGNRASLARLRLDQDAMAGFAQRRHAARNQAHARFVIFNFLRNSNDH